MIKYNEKKHCFEVLTEDEVNRRRFEMLKRRTETWPLRLIRLRKFLET